MRPPRLMNLAGEPVLMGMIGAAPSRPPNSTMSPTFLPMAGMTRTAVVLVLTTPMAISSAIRPEMTSAVVSPRNGYHVDADRADCGHGFELFERERARLCGRDHAFVLGDRDESAGQTADTRGRHDAALLDRVVEHARGSRSCRSAPQTSRPTSSRMRATESPMAGVGASDRSTMPNGTSETLACERADELTHAGDLERSLLDDVRDLAESSSRLRGGWPTATTPGPETPTMMTVSGSPMPWNAPAMNGLSSTALAKTTSLEQPMESLSLVSSAVCLMMLAHQTASASRLTPALVEATLTEEQTRLVSAMRLRNGVDEDSRRPWRSPSARAQRSRRRS